MKAETSILMRLDPSGPLPQPAWPTGMTLAPFTGDRRRGMGEALLLAAAAALKARGNTRVGLRVEAANPSGAQRLYERFGFVLA